MKSKAVIFDMDGVLWNSGLAHDRAFRRVLAEAGVTRQFEYSEIAGQRTRDVISAFCPSADPGEIERLSYRKTVLALEDLRSCNPVFPGAVDVLERISARFPIALATSGSRESVGTFLELNECRPLFQSVLHGGDIVRAKPDPEIYLKACTALGYDPTDCVVVEDAPSGIVAAKGAGCFVVAVGNTASASTLRTAGADEILDAVSDLPRWLGLDTASFRERYEIEQCSDGPQIASSEWTAVIPAAGRGTRLGYDLPKVLFPVAGRPILDWLLDLLLPVCGRIVVVASPSGAGSIAEHVGRRCGERGAVAIQPEPLGMANAVESGMPFVNTARTLVVWGDQVALRPSTIACAIRQHVGSAALATVPSILRKNPYIHFERELDGRLKKVLQAREGDAMPEVGESDTGLFLFQTVALRRYLSRAPKSPECRGAKTGEVNFLPLLPLVDSAPGNVVSLRIVEESESVGVNSRAEAEALAPVLLGQSEVGA
jgi:bifunctional UDP-N-acetylglucosamine pyrophosphorylase/glucosamine-1-phosphate N-acetyltransferase